MITTQPDAQTVAQSDDPLRYSFVEMLFALAISQVAIHAADLASIPASLLERAPAFMHLALGLVVIGASWVGWRQSHSPGIKQQIQSIFSRRALALLFDVLLVILYFILVRSVELQQKDGAAVLSAVSASPEAKWLLFIFGVYIVWDLLADVFSPDCLTQKGFIKTAWQGCRVGFVCSGASLGCLLLVLVVSRIASEVSQPLQVVLLDCALVMVVLLFRVLKVFEIRFAKIFRVNNCKAFTTPRPVTAQPMLLTLLLGLVYVGFIVAAMNPAS